MYRCFGVLLAAWVTLAQGCTSPDPEGSGINLVVEHHRQECQGMVQQLCLLVRFPDQADFSIFHHQIEGFSPEWGRSYEIEVRELPVANPPADAPSIRTVLHRVVREDPVTPGTEFELVVTSGAHRLVEFAPGNYRIYDQANFSCTDGASCAELNAATDAGDRIEYRFRYASFAPLEFELVEWRSCATDSPGSPCT